jgi:hypothetical protein
MKHFATMFLGLGLYLNSLAWNPFAKSDEYEEVDLSSTELSSMQFNAGWSKDDEHTLLFEIRNSLKAPVQCSGAKVELKDSSHVNKGFMPKIFIPPNVSRFASMPGVQKGTMKTYVVACSCFKRSGKGECLNPLKKP